MFIGLEHPFSCLIAGPSKCGKTVFLQKLIASVKAYVDPPPERIIWVYGIENSNQMKAISEMSEIPIEFTQTIPDINEFSEYVPTLLIIDDMMNDAGSSKTVADLFTKGCHHKNISVILVLQNLFHQGKRMRDIQTSTNYIVLFNNPRDKSTISHLSRQCFPEHKQFLTDAYNKACSKPFGYLCIDFNRTTPNNYRVSTGIFPPDIPRIFLPSAK
jgi:GTPase SAR1 family protein